MADYLVQEVGDHARDLMIDLMENEEFTDEQEEALLRIARTIARESLILFKNKVANL